MKEPILSLIASIREISFISLGYNLMLMEIRLLRRLVFFGRYFIWFRLLYFIMRFASIYWRSSF